MSREEDKLPEDLLRRASAGNEYAWRVDDIPEVIEAARAAGLASVGGQLQFRLPDGGTCECYWIEVDTYKSAPEPLPWTELVDRVSNLALADFQKLGDRFDFLLEGRKAFPDHLGALTDEALRESMWFVWYLNDAQTDARVRA